MQRLISHYVLSATLFVAFIATALPSIADDNQIQIPQPPIPRIVLPAAPPMIWLPVPKVYVAHKSPYPIFYQSGHYYLHDQDAWFIGPGYGGPWKALSAHRVPKNLRGFRKHHWGRYQNEAAQHFRDDDRPEHAPFYGRREAHEQHRPVRWREHESPPAHKYDRYEKQDKHEKKEKRSKHNHDGD